MRRKRAVAAPAHRHGASSIRHPCAKKNRPRQKSFTNMAFSLNQAREELIRVEEIEREKTQEDDAQEAAEKLFSSSEFLSVARPACQQRRDQRRRETKHHKFRPMIESRMSYAPNIAEPHDGQKISSLTIVAPQSLHKSDVARSTSSSDPPQLLQNTSSLSAETAAISTK